MSDQSRSSSNELHNKRRTSGSDEHSNENHNRELLQSSSKKEGAELCESPSVQFTESQLLEFARGTNKNDVAGNEYFDRRFYRNQLILHQHDVSRRSQSGARADARAECDDTSDVVVLAKRVAHPKDIACWIKVRQLAHLGSGTFSDVYLGTVTPRRAPAKPAKPTTSKAADSPELLTACDISSGFVASLNSDSFGDIAKKSRQQSDNPIESSAGKESSDGAGRLDANTTPVAIKTLWPDRSREDMQVSTHRLLHHHNIIELLYYYVCVHPRTKTIVWTLLLEPMPSTMLREQTRLSSHGRLMRMTYVKVFMYQTFSGLAYMERMNVLHRDIKPENLLVDMETGQLKIGDFGSSKHQRDGMPNSPYQVTRYYRAPELCLKYRYYCASVDVWAAGCVLCQLLTNRTVFYGRDNDDQLMKIFAICGVPTPKQMQQCAPGVEVNPQIYRLRYPKQDWYHILSRYNERVAADCADFVTKVLRYEAGQRLRGERALMHAFFDSLRKPGCLLPNGRPLPRLSL